MLAELEFKEVALTFTGKCGCLVPVTLGQKEVCFRDIFKGGALNKSLPYCYFGGFGKEKEVLLRKAKKTTHETEQGAFSASKPVYQKSK